MSMFFEIKQVCQRRHTGVILMVKAHQKQVYPCANACITWLYRQYNALKEQGDNHPYVLNQILNTWSRICHL